jgi:hypothetical protein
LLFPFKFPREFEGAIIQGGKGVRGTFVSRGEVMLSLISKPGGSEPTLQFVTLAGTTIDFFAEGSSAALQVRYGRVRDEIRTVAADAYYIECAKGSSLTAFEDEKSLADAAKPAKPLTELFAKPPAGAEPGAPDKPAPKPGEEARLGDLFRDKSKPAPSDSLRKPDAEIAKAGGGAGDPLAAGKPTPPVEPARPVTPVTPVTPGESGPGYRDDPIALALRNPDAAGAPRPVCEMRSLTPLAVPTGTTVSSLQAVGLRNDRAEARGFEYVDAAGDARALDGSLDIADSARKLVPYDAVAGDRRGGSGSLWVSIAGADETHLRRAAEPAAKPGKILRIIVVAGAAELAISGLDLVGQELGRPGGESVGLDIEWDAVDETGAIKRAGHYASFEQLVRDAAAKGRERPDVLNEGQLLTLFDGFESLLKSQTAPFDRVFWIKGAYAIPSSIPQRFEKFIATVSSASATPHLPSGQAGKWLVIVTSRMPGFSIAYLKEPVYSLQIGDVIEESEDRAGGPRRLIGDPVVLATRMRSTMKPARPGDAPPDRERDVLTGRLVLDAREVFVQRGYVLSPEAAQALQLHLRRVSSLWNGSNVRPDVLAGLASGSGKPQPSLADVLQLDRRSYPSLPKSLPDWFRKPIKDLAPDEAKSAQHAVAAYGDGANKLVEAARIAAAAPRASCGLFYVAETYFGFDRLHRAQASPPRGHPPRPIP